MPKATTKKPAKTKETTKVSTKEKGTPVINAWGKNLVIVESPNKIKKLKEFLGSWRDIKASVWHVIDLPKKALGIDIDNWFEPTYEITPEKKKVVSELKAAAKNYSQVWLATDPDREWEAIAWHLANALKLDLKTTPRIAFNEITKTAIQESIKNPSVIDMDLVSAQQWRRLLDRLVWFKISPVLWDKIKRGLSAWRVQSVAVKLIVEKEREIQNFKPEESWKLKAELTSWKTKFFITLEKIWTKKVDLKNAGDVAKLFANLWLDLTKFEETKDKKTWFITYTSKSSVEFRLADIDKKEVKRTPAAPFITSTLQQEAARRFGWWVKQIMSVAQKLYEWWHITYMRTDSVNLSGLAIGTAKEYIEKTYGAEYSQVRQYKSKSANAQEAHEAIRPSYISKTPQIIWLTGQEAKLYGLIWARTVACQMADAIIDTTTYVFNPLLDDNQSWTVKWEVVKFDWFLKLFEVTKDDEEITDEENQALPDIKVWEILISNNLIASQTFSKPPYRYTEASLVKKLEWLGIWRPSTYASIITTIQDRWYVEKDWKYLKPLDIAFTVNDYLEKFFTNLMDYKFTAGMEDLLDEISVWNLDWKKMLWDFWWDFKKHLETAWSKEEKMLVGKKCPECGGDLVYKFSKMWKFIGCGNYPECKYIEKTQEENSKLTELKAKYEWKPCEAWWTIVVKVGRFWPFLASSLYPEVKWIGKIPDEKVQDLETKFGWKPCPKCGKWVMHVKKSVKGRKVNYFLGCSNYPECKNLENIKEKKVEEENDSEE